VWGIDINPESVKTAAGQLDRAACGSFADMLGEYPDHYFDAILFNDVLEHLIDPYTFLERLKCKLAPGSVVVASIPNIRHFKTFRKLVFGRDWEYEDSGILDRTHLRFFTRNSIHNMFRRLGYDVLQCEGIHMTKSLKPWIYHVLSFGIWGLDTRFLQFAVVARPQK
jgi:2-polyprenyl-3-methyl-5-hydroxy-6-metoxy-1,4-benzoquinol methylase